MLRKVTCGETPFPCLSDLGEFSISCSLSFVDSFCRSQENYGLRCLNFAMNGLGLDGAECMGKALKTNRTLLQLDISFNRIPERGAGFIAVGLQTNDVLQGIKVSLRTDHWHVQSCKSYRCCWTSAVTEYWRQALSSSRVACATENQGESAD